MPNELHEDRYQIQQIAIRYCELVDGRDWDAMSEVFTEDTVGVYNDMEVVGLQTLVDSGKRNMCSEALARTQHNVMNFRIDVDGDQARCRSHYYAVHLGGKGFEGQILSMWGEYDDKLVRTSAGWRIARRDYETFFSEGPLEMCFAGDEPAWNEG